MARVQFGWWIPVGPRDQILRRDFLITLMRGVHLVTGSFDSVWYVDHLQDPTPLLEGWTALTYLSALCPSLCFGHAVLCQSYRNPALLAKMAATIQYMSEGRFIFGIGAGWKKEEYSAYGYDFPSLKTRIEELEEALHIITALWKQEEVTLSGKHHRVVRARCDPRPDPLPPIMIGGSGSGMLRLVARYADWWNVSWMSASSYQRKVEECERICAIQQRDPLTLRRTWFSECICASTEGDIQALNKTQLSREGAFIGTPAQILEQVRPLVALGVDYFILSCGGFPQLTTLELLVSEVLPALNR